MRSQRVIIYEELLANGSITTERAKELGVNRLPVMIERLRKQGMVIDMFHVNGGKGFYIWRKK